MEKRKGLYRIMGILFAVTAAGSLLLSACSEQALAGENLQTGGSGDLAVIDPDRTCSLTIYKYDQTTAKENGVEVDEQSLAYGETNADVQELFADYAVEGVEFSYLYCGDICTYTGGSEDAREIEVVCAVPERLCGILGLEETDAYQLEKSSGARYYSTDQIQAALTDLLENGTTGTGDSETDKNKLAKNVLEDYLIHHKDTKRMPLTDAEGRTSVSGLSAGLYLIVETKVPENVTETVNPWFVTLPFTADSGDRWTYDLTCYPKNQTGMPTLDKLVRDAIEAADGRTTAYGETATASEGETLEYICVSRLPHIQSRATWLTEYTFSDVLSEGLTYGADVKIAFYASRDAAYSNDLSRAVEQWGISGDRRKMFVQEYGKTDDSAPFSGTTMNVTMTQKGLNRINENYSDYWMTVSYTATMHSDDSVVLGDDGNPNEVTLLWRRTSDSWFDTLEDNCLVFTYGVDLKKIFSDDGGDPAKVEFLLKYTTDDTYLTASPATGADGETRYYITGRTEKEADATRFSPGADGTFQICGLRADAYELTEEKTDKNYQLLSRAVGFELVQTEWTGSQKNAATAVVDGQATALNEKGRLNLEIVNYRRVLIPQTGDNTLPVMAVLGSGLVVCGCILLRRKKVA